MVPSVKDILDAIDSTFPFSLAEEWDNSGLQVGSLDWKVERIVVSLDPLPSVVGSACRDSANLLITHHPLILSGIKRIDFSRLPGKVIHDAASAGLAIISVHTNIDAAPGGLNEALAKKIGLLKITPLTVSDKGSSYYKLVFFVPREHEDRILGVLFDRGLGRIGNYSCCSFRTKGTGTFLPEKGAVPFIAEPEGITEVDESRIEVLVEAKEIAGAINALKAVHPYETAAFDLYPVRVDTGTGFGKVGFLEREILLEEFADQLKDAFGLRTLRVAGERKRKVRRVAVCSGSGGALVDAFLASGADLFVTGDIKYHEAREIESRQKSVIDLGHFFSEQIFIRFFSEKLKELCTDHGWKVEILECKTEIDPFYFL